MDGEMRGGKFEPVSWRGNPDGVWDEMGLIRIRNWEFAAMAGYRMNISEDTGGFDTTTSGQFRTSGKSQDPRAQPCILEFMHVRAPCTTIQPLMFPQQREAYKFKNLSVSTRQDMIFLPTDSFEQNYFPTGSCNS